jgi:protein SCO1/2
MRPGNRSQQFEPLMSAPKAVALGVIAAAAAVAGMVVASFVFAPKKTTLASGTLLQQARAIPEFQLQGLDGQAFTKAQLRDKWTLIFVGFTHCPDVCPNTMGVLKSVAATLEEQKRPLQVVLLSVDPERDQPEQLATYVRYFNPAFTAATGPTAELDRLASALGFAYVKVPGATADSYTIDHSTALILVNPKAELAGFFTPPLKSAALAEDLARLIPAAS